MILSFATWNCADGFAKKIPFLQDIAADIITLQEVREAAFLAAAPLYKHAFFQRSATARGLAVFSNLDCKISPLPLGLNKKDTCYLPLAFNIQGTTVDVLSSWVKPVEDYVRPSQRVFRKFFKHSQAPHKVILGDLNQNMALDKKRRLGLFKKTDAIMRRNAMRSLYHENAGEEYGSETLPTHFLTYNVKRSYHLDYIFASSGLRLHNFELYPTDPWFTERRSDHLPMRCKVSI